MCHCNCKETPDGECELYPPFDVNDHVWVTVYPFREIKELVDEAKASLETLQATENVLCDIFDERCYQNQKLGQQDNPDGTHAYYEFEQGIAKARMAEAVEGGFCTWTHILLEEVFEAVSETQQDKLRAELVQIAAVATAWVEAIDRRG